MKALVLYRTDALMGRCLDAQQAREAGAKAQSVALIDLGEGCSPTCTDDILAAEKVWMMMQNIDHPWTENEGVTTLVSEQLRLRRSMMVGDIIVFYNDDLCAGYARIKPLAYEVSSFGYDHLFAGAVRRVFDVPMLPIILHAESLKKISAAY